MPPNSKYDQLHDKYNTILSTKSGTRYERLAAMVFKLLELHKVVIHDLKLVGDSDVAHQIDVSIEMNGVTRRVVVECKDFDVSENPVGLGILRDFRSVIEGRRRNCRNVQWIHQRSPEICKGEGH